MILNGHALVWDRDASPTLFYAYGLTARRAVWRKKQIYVSKQAEFPNGYYASFKSGFAIYSWGPGPPSHDTVGVVRKPRRQQQKLGRRASIYGPRVRLPVNPYPPSGALPERLVELGRNAKFRNGTHSS